MGSYSRVCVEKSDVHHLTLKVVQRGTFHGRVIVKKKKEAQSSKIARIRYVCISPYGRFSSPFTGHLIRPLLSSVDADRWAPHGSLILPTASSWCRSPRTAGRCIVRTTQFNNANKYSNCSNDVDARRILIRWMQI